MKRTYVPPNGNENATLAIVAEQPGMSEIRARPPRGLIGPAGQALDEVLAMAKILRRDLWISNVIKDLDMPLSHYIELKSNGRSTVSEEGQQYINELRDELSQLPNLNCVVALGGIATLALTSRVGITKWRGSVLESTLVKGLKVVPTFHTATFIPPKFNFLNRPLIFEDLKRAKTEATSKYISRKVRDVRIRPSFAECQSYLSHCYEVGCRGQTLGIDIEVINGEVDCFSVGPSPTNSICVPLRDATGDYFTPDQELEVMLSLAKIMQEERITKVGANFIFDTQFLFRKYGMLPRGTLNCTQIAQKIAYPDFSAGLDFVTTMHTDIPYYKADGKQWMKMGTGTWEEWWNYNGLDGLVPVEAFPKQMQHLAIQNNEATYERQRKLIPVLLYMGERGIKVDVQGMVTYRDEQQAKLEQLAEDLNREVGHDINYNSPKQLMDYFYNELGLPPYKKRNAHGKYVPSSDVDALKRIFRKGGKGSDAARIMLDIRGLTKRISTYLNVGKVDKDGRYRSSYKPVGAETGRLSSGETIFGTGGNQQNWPHDLLRFFIFDEGYIGYSYDLSQIENRIVAYVGGVIPQIRAFEEGIDLHKMTASFIFDKPYDQISSEDGSSDLGDGRQSERFWGKKGNHAINYDVSYKTFALVNEMPEGDAKYLLETIHRGYPQIRAGYQATIEQMLKKNRTVTNLFGRNRLFMGPIYQDRFTPKYACEETFRQAYAQMGQSTCADKINEQGLEFIYYNQDLFSPVELLAQIHDAIVFQIPLSLPWQEHARILLLIKHSLEIPLSWHGKVFATPADLMMGFNMCKDDMKELKSKQIPESATLLAEILERNYNDLRRIRVGSN